MLKKLWNDESGVIISAELILVLTILFCGLVVGLTTLRDAVVTELADVGASIASLNQSYSFGGVQGHHGTCTGSLFNDGLDTCDDVCSQPGGANSRCVTICTGGAAHEGGGATSTTGG